MRGALHHLLGGPGEAARQGDRVKTGTCARCGVSTDRLYPRPRGPHCVHCADLSAEGRTSARSGRDPKNPRSQPTPLPCNYTKQLPCIWCTASCYPQYRWGTTIISACGWGCAGLWMDAQIDAEHEARELEQDEQYVLRSLGVSEQ